MAEGSAHSRVYFASVVTTVEKLGNYSVIDYCSDCVNSARLCS